jgi:Ser/Thr protein kinase RdoA (MazF antagonist)
MLPYRAQIAKMRRVAVRALASYPVDVSRLRFVSHGENTTFRVTSPTTDYLLRVHRPNRHGRGVDSAEAIRSELQWLEALRDSADVSVPAPVRTRDGGMTVTAGETEVRVCSLLRWMDGRIRNASPHPVHLQRLGHAMAKLHDHAERWAIPPGFTRMRWDREGFFGDRMEYGGVGSADCWNLLPTGVRGAFHRVEDRVATTMAELGEGPDAFGLIHADLHLENALFAGDGVRLIDFDDCGFGYWLYDIAVSLWELRHLGTYPTFRDAFIAGYREQRRLTDDRLDERIDTFIAAREVAFGLWYAGTAQVNPRFRDRFDRTMDGIAKSLEQLSV